MKRFVKSFLAVRFPALILSSIAMAPAGAQDRSEAESLTLEEILVTARKREESLQDVAISISVVSGRFLQDNNVAKLENLAPTIPNFHHSEAVSGNDQLFIRGVGSGVNFGFENSVGQVFDGFFFGRSRFGRSLFMDLERVEILKGPQGALIGKNTTAGAINITSAKPTDEFEAYVIPTWEFEGDDGYSLEGALSGPLNERVRGRISFRYDDRDGFFTNLTRDEEEMKREELYVRTILDFDVTEDLSARLLYQYGDQERIGRNVETAKCSAAFLPIALSAGDDCEHNLTNSRILLVNGVEVDSTTNTDTHLAGLTIDWETALGTVTSLTGYSEYTLDDHWDADGLSIEATSLTVHETWEQWSEELRLASAGDNTVDYIAGIYLLSTDHETRFALDPNLQGPPPLPALPPVARQRNNRWTDEEGETIAVFGELTWHLDPQWDLIGGLRFTHEEKDAHHREFATALYTDTPIPPPPFGPAANMHDVTDDRSVDQWTPNGVVQYRPVNDVMLYASASRGFKGGGFDNQLSGNQEFAEANFEFDDEEVTAYELGGKFNFPEAKFQLNVAVFYSDITDVQVSSQIPDGSTLFKVGNAASATTQGVELDFRWMPTERLRFNGAVGYLDAEFDEYKDAPCYDAQTPAQGCVNNVQDISGGELQFAPHWKFTLEGAYTWPLPGNLDFTLSSRVYRTGEQALALDLDPRLFEPASTKLDASLILASGGGGWRVSLIGQNLTDEITANFGNDGPGPPGASVFYFSAPPRSIALQARIEY